MFSQRKTDSFDLIGTNGRNSDASMDSGKANKYGVRLINTLTFEQFDQTYEQQLDQIFGYPTQQRQSSLSSDPSEYLIGSNFCRKTIDCETNIFDLDNDLYNPFECPKQTMTTCFSNNEQEESTHDSLTTNSCSDKRSQFTLSPTNSDLEDIVNDAKLEKLMQDLDFIDQPLAPKRIRKTKAVMKQNSSVDKEMSESSESAEEQRRRKNKEQVNILLNEYVKNTNWTRAFMKELAKKAGLKTSQVYKWNWDQKKKEQDQQKLQKLYYPNEIFQVLDTQGNNIATKVVHKFVIDKADHSKQQ